MNIKFGRWKIQSYLAHEMSFKIQETVRETRGA